jgi:polysaccharide deacetylase family protein (PEP-CTERM system associated)
MLNAMTIDWEDYYSVFSRDWLGMDRPCDKIVAGNTERVLSLLSDHNVKATFFVLGELAEQYPSLVRGIARAGHEIGVHGYSHRQVFKLTIAEFTQDVERTKKLVEDQIGQSVLGFRAPAFSIMPATSWALDVLANMGFRYDSSIVPCRMSRYGWEGFRRDAHVMTLETGKKIVELPISTVSILGRGSCVAGGGYLRLYPYWFTRHTVGRINRSATAVVYVHPYDMDLARPSQDFADALAIARPDARKHHARQLSRRGTVENKLSRLMTDFQFAPCKAVLADLLAAI